MIRAPLAASVSTADRPDRARPRTAYCLFRKASDVIIALLLRHHGGSRDPRAPTPEFLVPGFRRDDGKGRRPRRSSQLQRGEAREREHEADDPEADDDSRLRPAHLLEMMVEDRKSVV